MYTDEVDTDVQQVQRRTDRPSSVCLITALEKAGNCLPTIV